MIYENTMIMGFIMNIYLKMNFQHCDGLFYYSLKVFDEWIELRPEDGQNYNIKGCKKN